MNEPEVVGPAEPLPETSQTIEPTAAHETAQATETAEASQTAQATETAAVEPTPGVEAIDIQRTGAALDGVLRDLRGDERRIERSLEALLVSTRVALSVEDMSLKLGLTPQVVEAALLRLAADLEERALGLFHRDKDGKRRYILDVKAAYRPDVAAVAPPLLKQNVTETLALIAINQPVSQSRLVRERGTTVYEHVKELLDRGLVQRLKQGRSYVLRTTDGFAAEFGLENEPELIRRALARAAGVQGDPEIIGSPRIHLGGESTAPELVDEARRVAAENPPPPPQLPPSRLPSDAFDPDAQTSDPECIISGGEPPKDQRGPFEPEAADHAEDVEVPYADRGGFASPDEEEHVQNPTEQEVETRTEEETATTGDASRIARLIALTGDGAGDDW